MTKNRTKPVERLAYDVDFDWENSHGRLVELFSARPERGVVVDIGCGYAPHAEPLRDAGFAFVGFDADHRSIAALRDRGFDARHLDLAAPNAVSRALDSVIADGTGIVGVLALDVIEHLVDPHRMLGALAQWMAQHDVPILGVSVPNVSFHDIAFKLVDGRWDVTPTGLLDETHLRFFTSRSLTNVMTSAGFREAARNDRSAPISDQHWPIDSPLLSEHTRSGAWIRMLRGRADDHGSTYQFVRLYDVVTDQHSAPTLVAPVPQSSGVFLSVIAHPDREDPDCDRLRAQLLAQTCNDWELVESKKVSSERSPRERLARLLDQASGQYVAVVGPHEHVEPHWVEQFFDAAVDVAPVVLRCSTPDDADMSVGFDEVLELRTGASPTGSFAIPRGALCSLLDEAGDEVCGEPGDAIGQIRTLLFEVLALHGVVGTGVEALTLDDAWTRPTLSDADIAAYVRSVDAQPRLFPPGSVAALMRLQTDNEWLNAQLVRLQTDNEWLNAQLATLPVRLVRKVQRLLSTNATPPPGG